MNISRFVKPPFRLPLVVGVGGMAVGAALTYFLEKRKPKVIGIRGGPQFNTNLDWEGVSTVIPNKTPDSPTKEAAQRLHPSSMGPVIGYEPEPEPEDMTPTRTDNTVAERQADLVARGLVCRDDGWDYEEELRKREEFGPHVPYVVHREEFWSEESGLPQETWTYFEKDGIMADQEEHPVFNYSDVIGDLKFGHGSDDPNTFFVRNEKRGVEVEVVLTKGSFAEDVEGLSEDQLIVKSGRRGGHLQHGSGPPKMPKLT